MPKRYYHFVAGTLRDGSPIPKDGEWITVKGGLELCKTGLHASEHVADALQFAPGPTLCLVELRGEVLTDTNKVCARSRKIVARFDATELLRADARASALSVIHLWRGGVPPAVRHWLETGDKQYRSAAWSAAESAAESAAWSAARSAAWSAAESAAWSAAESAAWSAAWSAARSAAWSTARKRLQDAVDAKFAELLK